ncbi:MAG: hypothetical protein ACLFVJ_00400 [Persicimonas sp.]
MNGLERQSIGFLIVLAAFALACGLLDDDDTNVTHEEAIPFSFDIDANELCPQDDPAVDCDAEEDAPTDVELEPIEFAVDIDVVEKTGNEELRDYTNAFRSIEITSIEYQAANNDLNFDLPDTTLYLGPLGSERTDDEGVVELATIPEIAAGQDDSGRATVAQAGRDASSELLQNLEAAAVAYAQPVIEEGEPLPPSGDATMNITINVEFTANPQDAL